jgi:single-stranded DNA-binding protein
MHSFKLIAVGNLARSPEVSEKGDTTYTKFCLIGNDYAGKDAEGNPKDVATSLYFVAFNGTGEVIARNARKGDQLIVEAHIRSNNWTDEQNEKHYDYSYIVDSFKFGAKGPLSRDERAQRRDSED